MPPIINDDFCLLKSTIYDREGYSCFRQNQGARFF